jgi:hypothetical protein
MISTPLNYRRFAEFFRLRGQVIVVLQYGQRLRSTLIVAYSAFGKFASIADRHGHQMVIPPGSPKAVRADPGRLAVGQASDRDAPWPS